jgi:hypothetical protein
MATKAANRDIIRLAYMRLMTTTISWAGPDHAVGGAGSSPRAAEWLSVRRMARRYAAVVSFGSGSSFVWVAMTNDVLMAENRPA